MRRLGVAAAVLLSAAVALAQSPIQNPPGDVSQAVVQATGSTTPRTLANRFDDAVNVKDYGAKQDGTTDDATAINAAITAAAATGRAVVIYNTGQNTVVGSPIVPLSETDIECVGNPVIFLKAASNTPVIESLNFQSLIGTSSTGGTANVVIRGCVIDGNSANQTAAVNPDFQTGISIYGIHPKISQVVVRNIFGNGIYTGYPTGTTAGTQGYEPTFDDIWAITIGRRGFWIKGPTDGHFDDIQVIDASQNADATYEGIRLEVSGNVDHFHGWHTAAATNRVSYQGYFSGSVLVEESEFEGGRQQVFLTGTNNQLVNDKIFAPFGAANTALVDVSSGANLISNSIFTGSNSTDYYAINLTNSASGNTFSTNQFYSFKTNTPLNCSADGGENTFFGYGFVTAGGGTTFGGSCAASDIFSYTQGGTVIHQFNPVVTGGSVNNAIIGATTPVAATFSGLSVGTNAAAGSETINGQTASSQVLLFATAGSSRWRFLANNAAESGGNAGTNMVLQSFDDTGTFLANTMNITRATSAIAFAGPLSNPGTISNGTTFTIASGCGTPTSLTGGQTTGSFAAGQAACAPVINLPTAPHGWWCVANDITHPADLFTQTATGTTSCTLSATVTSSDTVVFHAEGY